MELNKFNDFASDFYRHKGRPPKWPWLESLWDPGLRFLYHLRAAQKYSKKHPLGILHRLILRKLRIRYGYQISPETQIGKGLYLGHWGAVVINPETKLGDNCNIAQGVTIGQTNRGKLKGVPTFGNEVWIGANAVIVGKVLVGNNVLIAPNAYVNFDVPDNSIVMGNPAQVIPNPDATDAYINRKV